jgi:hypothetical protein
MYQRVEARTAQRLLETPACLDPGEAARQGLARVRKVLTAFVPGMSLDRSRLQAALAGALAQPDVEAERLFALGWLRWLEGETVAAEPLLAEALRQARQVNALPLVAESAYWLARVRILLNRAEALSDFEAVLRTLGGSPQATAWFVDLLWRAGRVDRAEQVWKSVRGNRKVSACPEGALLEARALLRKGESAAAERLLNEEPAHGVVWVERLLLLAWAFTAQKQFPRVQPLLQQAGQGPYPAAAMQSWQTFLERRGRGELLTAEKPVPAALRDFLTGQQARLAGQREEAVRAHRAALASPGIQPFARYALACLGEEDLAALLASQPGLFLAVRCRAQLALERFRQRQSTPAECLDALHLAGSAGFQTPPAEHFRRLAHALQQRQPTPDGLRELATTAKGDAVVSRNFLRAAVELAVRRLPPPAALELLLEWAQEDQRVLPEDLRPVIGRQLLRLLLLQRTAGAGDVHTVTVLATLERLLPEEPLRTLARTVFQPGEESVSYGEGNFPTLQLFQASQVLGRLEPASNEGLPESWRQQVRDLRSHAPLQSLAQALLLQEAAQRGDVPAVASLLDEGDRWQNFRSGPPSFVLASVASLAARQPMYPDRKRSLARWLQRWDQSALGPVGATLADQAGLRPVPADTAEAPPGVAAAPWFLHLAAQALGRDDAVEALNFTRRALAADPDLTTVSAAGTVHASLPELERRALAHQLGRAMRWEQAQAALPAPLLADVVDLLESLPDGGPILEALARGDPDTARRLLDDLSARLDLPPRLAHHLALSAQRAALGLEEREETQAAAAHWRRSWSCWLHYLTSPADEPAALAPQRTLVLDYLFGLHRRRVQDLLARNAIDRARCYWNLVQELPSLAKHTAESLAADLVERVDRFRDELATDYLLTTREAMRYGDIPEGFHADYPKGLSFLQRLLSLDRENLRLLTALVEICTEWFLDLYNATDPPRLRTEVERFTPFALQLARLIEDRPGDLTARAALADFCKFRGFVSGDRDQKVTLYREALRFNPANRNVRDLLADLGEPLSEG